MKLDLSDFDGVAFDFDGTLANSYPVHAAARMRAFSDLGYGHITSEEQALGHTYGSSVHTIIGGVLKAAGAIEPNTDSYTDPRVQAVVTLKKQYFLEAAEHGLGAFPGALEFVREMARSFPGKVAIVTTGFDREVLPFIQKYALDDIFPNEFIITHDTTNALELKLKPEPDAYIRAGEVLKIKDMKRLLVIEDSTGGVEAGKRAGATVLAMGTTNSREVFYKDTLKYLPDHFASSFADINLV